MFLNQTNNTTLIFFENNLRYLLQINSNNIPTFMFLIKMEVGRYVKILLYGFTIKGI